LIADTSTSGSLSNFGQQHFKPTRPGAKTPGRRDSGFPAAFGFMEIKAWQSYLILVVRLFRRNQLPCLSQQGYSPDQSSFNSDGDGIGGFAINT